MSDRDMVYHSNVTNQDIPMCKSGIYIGTTPLHSWEYDFKKNKRNMSGFTRSKRTIKLDVAFANKELANKARHLFETDVKNNAPGTLQCGDWSMDIYVTGAEKDVPTALIYELSIVPIDGVWRRRISASSSISQSEESSDFLNYPYNYPYDFMGYSVSALVNTKDYYDCPVDIYFYGPCVNPFVTVNSNVYQVNIEIPQGCYVHVDGVKKTVTLVSKLGLKQNVFHAARRDKDAYIFKTLPNGSFTIHVKSGVTADIGWFEEDSELPWT